MLSYSTIFKFLAGVITFVSLTIDHDALPVMNYDPVRTEVVNKSMDKDTFQSPLNLAPGQWEKLFAEVIRYEQYGYGSQYAHIYIPDGYALFQRKAAIIYLHGAGQRGDGIDTSGLDEEGPPESIKQGDRPNCIVISPQLPNVSLWDNDAVAAAIDHVIANYDVDPDQIYLDGYSLGYTGLFDFLKEQGYRIAAVHGLAGHFEGALGWTSAYADSISRVPVRFSHAGGDATQPIANSVRIFDSILNPNHTTEVLPQTSFFFGSSHGASDEIVYANYDDDIASWLMLHHRNIDSTAEYHMDSLERAGTEAPWNMYTRTERLVNNLGASAHKTDLLSRLQAVYDLMNGGSDYVKAVLDLGVAAKTSTGNVNNMTNGNTGQILSNMIDWNGAATTWDFNIVLRTNSTEEEDKGEPRGYWIWDQPNAFDDLFSVFSINSGSWRLQGLDNTKLYTIRMTGGGSTYSAGTRYGLNVTINGVTKSIDLVYKNTDKYIEFKDIAPTSGNITIEPDGAVTNALAGIAIIEIIQQGTDGNETPVANAGADQEIIQPESTTSMIGSGSDGDGTIVDQEWAFISGPVTPTIVSPNSYFSAITGMSAIGVYVFQLTVTDDGGATHSDQMQVTVLSGDPDVDAGRDSVLAYNQADQTPAVTITATHTGPTPDTWEWIQIAGPTAVLSGETTASMTLTNPTKGIYQFQVTVNGINSDTVQYYFRDYNEAGSWPARPGGGKVFHVGHTLVPGVVTDTTINMSYINKAPYPLGEPVYGNDIIVMYRNPNNGGVWKTITMGYFGGEAGAPVVIIPRGQVQWGSTNNAGYFRLGAGTTADSGFVNHVVFWGDWNRSGTDSVYGFYGYSSDSSGFSIVGHLARNITFRGVHSEGTLFMLKKDADSSKVWTIWNNYNNGPFVFKNCLFRNAKEEIFYIGGTNIDGQGNGGPIIQASPGSVVDSCIFINIGWDGVQWSAMGDSVVFSNIVTYNTGTKSQSSQQTMAQMGGYITKGRITRSVFIKGTGGVNILGGGRHWFNENIVDSVSNGGAADYSSLYISSSVASSEPPPYPDSLEVFVEDNIFAGNEQWAINFANSSGRIKDGGGIHNNLIVDTTGRTDLINVTNAVVPESGNTYVTALNIDTTALARSLPAWEVYKMVRAAPNEVTSFFHIDRSVRHIFRFPLHTRPKRRYL